MQQRGEKQRDHRRRIVERIDERRRNPSVERQTHGVTDQRARHDEKRERGSCQRQDTCERVVAAIPGMATIEPSTAG